MLTNSPGVPGAGTGGATWSKKPPFSSQVTNSAVFAHSLGSAVRAESTWLVAYSPMTGGEGGCSVCTSGASTQETCGRLPAAMSARKVSGWEVPEKVGTKALAASSESLRNFEKSISRLVPALASGPP